MMNRLIRGLNILSIFHTLLVALLHYLQYIDKYFRASMYASKKTISRSFFYFNSNHIEMREVHSMTKGTRVDGHTMIPMVI